MIAQDAFKRNANAHTNESGIVFWMKPLGSLRVIMLHNSLREAGFDSTSPNFEGQVANAFIYLEGYCVDIEFPDDLSPALSDLKLYWGERGPLSVVERFELFTEAFNLDTYSVLSDAWFKTRDATLSAPDELREVPTDNDDSEKKSA